MTTCWTAGAVVAGDRVLTPGTVTVTTDGLLAEVRAGARPGATHLGGEAILAPGAVDLHSDAVEKLAEPRPGVRLPFGVAVRALDHRMAGAGVTTAYAALSLAGAEIGLRERAATESLARELRDLLTPRVEHRLHLRVEITDGPSVTAAEELVAAGRVALLSVMNHTPGQGQFPTLDSYVTFYRRNYAETEQELHSRVGVKVAAGVHLGSRVARLAAAARRAGIPLAWHDPDSAATVERAREHGASIAEFPTTIEAARAAGPAGLAVGMGAPNLLLRRSTSGNLGAVEALAAGAVDLLVSDYYPEAMWPAALGAGRPLAEAVRLVATAPARAAGLTDRGVIAPGLRADLVALRCDGTVLRTLVRGRVVA
jgi:alpha-D-ribose 1-methylphosphonate 5-triphosphate diphosphatase